MISPSTLTVSGCAGRKLFSPVDKRVRPMMEKVRGALFSMLLSQSGDARFPGGMRWLDLYAGTVCF
jgi:16S rRNA G966 N2-methylase RsmD